MIIDTTGLAPEEIRELIEAMLRDGPVEVLQSQVEADHAAIA